MLRRQSSTSSTPMRLVATAGVLCALWLGQARLQAQYQQLPQSPGFPAAPSPLNSLPAGANAVPTGNGASAGNAVNGANAIGPATPTAQAGGESPKIPMTNLFAAIRQGGVMMIRSSVVLLD